MVAAQTAPGAIPVKPDPGLIDDDLPVIIKPVVSKPVAESIPIRPDPVLDELLAPLQQSAANKEAAAPPVMPHVLPQLPTAEAASQAPAHSFSKKPLEAPDPLFQATQQNVMQHMAPPQPPEPQQIAPESKEAAGIKYNVFGIPIGPDSEPLVDDKTALEGVEVANKAIVNEAAKTAARTHPGLPAGFTIPDPNPSMFTLPALADSARFKARGNVSAGGVPGGAVPGLPPTASPQAPAPLVAPPPSAASDSTVPAAPVKGRKGRKGKSVEVAASEPSTAAPEPAIAKTDAPETAAPVAEAPSSATPPAASITPAASTTGAVQPPNTAAFDPVGPGATPSSLPSQLPPAVDIVAAAAAAAFGQLPTDTTSPLQAASSSPVDPEVDEEGFIIQTFVEPVGVVDPDRTMTLPAQQPPIQPPLPQAPTPNPWDSPMQPPPPPPPPPMPTIPAPQQQPIQPAAQAQKPLLQQWAAQAKENAEAIPNSHPNPVSQAAPAQMQPIEAQVPEPNISAETPAQSQSAAPGEPPPPPGPTHSHDHIVGDKYQTGAGEHHRGSWMEQGPSPNVPNLGVPLPAGYDPDKPKDIGTPVRKGPQRPQISPLYQESFKSPVEMPPVVPPAVDSTPPAVAEGGINNALDDNENMPGMPSVPVVPDNIGKKGKNVAWGGIKGGLSRGQRSEDTPQVYKDQALEPEAESAFPEVAARPMLPQQGTSQGVPSQQSQQPSLQAQPALPPQPVQQPVPSFAQGNDDAPHCPECSARLEGGSNFCGECGYKLGVRIPTCVSCQAPLDPTARFCGECGAKVADPAGGANPAPSQGSAAPNAIAPQDPEKAMEDYLSGFGPNQKDKHWSNKLKKILD
jgi:hypothetical protein